MTLSCLPSTPFDRLAVAERNVVFVERRQVLLLALSALSARKSSQLKRDA
jgi:hypothetical protein